ncbi:MAG: LCP family protein, partial [Rhodoferax sp.]|nr:LCP family protein [Actinomycetota bacterium]
AGAGLLALRGDVVARVLTASVQPRTLLVAGVTIAVVAAAWCVTVLATAWTARPERPSVAPRALGVALVAALCTAIAAPSSVGVRYALIQRDVVTSLFTTGTTSGTAVAGGAVPVQGKADPWAGVPRVNMLLLGSDAGRDRTGVRTDSMIVASIDTHTGDAVLFGLPRNLERVPFPASDPLSKVWPNGFDCGSVCLLNAVWEQAATTHRDLFPGDPNPGLTATRDVIGEVLGLKIDTYTIIDLSGFQALVDAMGGVDINVPRRIPIGGGHNQATGNALPIYGYIEPGRQHLDGYHALWFSRSREGSDDYDRMGRQRCMVSALLDQANPVQLLARYPALAKVAKNNIQSGIRQQDLAAWVTLVERIQRGKIRSLPTTNKVVDVTDPDFAKIRRLVATAITPKVASTPTPGATATARPKPDLATAQDAKAVC